MGDDIYQGLQDDCFTERTIVFSVGYRCTSSSLIKEMNMKFESYPFDWIVSKPETVIHCIDNDFQEYLNKDHYVNIERSQTFNRFNNIKYHVCYEPICYNTYYENKQENLSGNEIGTYERMLSLTHHNMHNEKDYHYFQRCVTRFRRMLASTKQKFYLYTHPLISINTFKEECACLLGKFCSFAHALSKHSANIFGIFFMIVQRDDKKHQVEVVYDSSMMTVVVIYANNQLVDAGATYSGDFHNEQHKMLTTIESIIRDKTENSGRNSGDEI